MATPEVLIMMSDYGHDPTETAVPYAHFKKAGFHVSFATETGKPPVCDKKMIEGLTGKLLGAAQRAIQDYHKMVASEECKHPLSWTAPNFSLESYSLVLFPGGHDKSVRQVIDSPAVHKLVAEHMPRTRKPSNKAVGAVCHGVMALAAAKDAEGKSVLRDFVTTALPAFFENGIFWATRAFLGDYYKTYGAGSENVEEFVRKALDNPEVQYKNSLGPGAFVVEDPKYNYISARFPGDAELFAQKMVEMVNGSLKA